MIINPFGAYARNRPKLQAERDARRANTLFRILPSPAPFRALVSARRDLAALLFWSYGLASPDGVTGNPSTSTLPAKRRAGKLAAKISEAQGKHARAFADCFGRLLPENPPPIAAALSRCRVVAGAASSALKVELSTSPKPAPVGRFGGQMGNHSSDAPNAAERL